MTRDNDPRVEAAKQAYKDALQALYDEVVDATRSPPSWGSYLPVFKRDDIAEHYAKRILTAADAVRPSAPVGDEVERVAPFETFKAFEKWYSENVSPAFVEPHTGTYDPAHAVFGKDVWNAWQAAISALSESSGRVTSVSGDSDSKITPTETVGAMQPAAVREDIEDYVLGKLIDKFKKSGMDGQAAYLFAKDALVVLRPAAQKGEVWEYEGCHYTVTSMFSSMKCPVTGKWRACVDYENHVYRFRREKTDFLAKFKPLHTAPGSLGSTEESLRERRAVEPSVTPSFRRGQTSEGGE